MCLSVRYVERGEARGIAGQWAARREDIEYFASQDGVSWEAYPRWDWERWIAGGSYLCFGLFEGDSVEALVACEAIEHGLEMRYLQSAPDNYFALGDQRARLGAGRALVAALARLCHLHAGDAALLVGRDALLESIAFYDRLGFAREGGYDPHARVYKRIALRVPPLTELIAQHYAEKGTAGAEAAYAAIQTMMR